MSTPYESNPRPTVADRLVSILTVCLMSPAYVASRFMRDSGEVYPFPADEAAIDLASVDWQALADECLPS